MALHIDFFECPTCEQKIGHLRPAPSHGAHLLAALVTGGLWVIVWGISAYTLQEEPSACMGCGSRRPWRAAKPKVHSTWESSSSRAPEGSGE